MTMRKSLSHLALAALAAAMLLAGCKPATETTTTASSGTETPAAPTGGGTSTRATPTAAGNDAGAEGDIKIGIVASLNGDLKPWGVDSVKGAQMAVDEFNAAGGLGGRKVVLLQGDSASRPEQGKSAAEKLIADGALGIVGEVASGITAQIAQSAFEKGVPVVAIGATRTDLTERGANIFRVCYTDDFQGPVMATFAYNELKLRNVAVMTDNKQPYSQGLSQSFRQHFEKLGGKIVDEQFYESGQTQFTSQLTNLKGKNPDGLFLSGYFTEVGPIARQAKEVGLNVRLLGGDGWDSAELLTSGGQAILGGFFCNHYNNREQKPEVQNFLSAYRAKFGGEPGTTMAALGYDATKLVLDALKRASAPNSKELISALENTENFAGVSGTITLKGMNGNPRKRALVVEVTAQGQAFRKSYEFDDIF